MSETYLRQIKYSILDLVTVIEGKSPADTFINGLDLARQADNLGYIRYWFAKHHNMICVASSAKSILMDIFKPEPKALN